MITTVKPKKKKKVCLLWDAIFLLKCKSLKCKEKTLQKYMNWILFFFFQNSFCIYVHTVKRRSISKLGESVWIARFNSNSKRKKYIDI